MVSWLTKGQVRRLLEQSNFSDIWLKDNEFLYFGNDKDVTLYWDGSDLVFDSLVGPKMIWEFAGTEINFFGGSVTGDTFNIQANTIDSGPVLGLEGGEDAHIRVGVGKNVNFWETASNFMIFNRSGSTYTTDATSGTGWIETATSITSGIGHLITATGLIDGSAHKVVGDSDNLTSGRLYHAVGGAASDKNWLEVIKSTADTEGCQLVVDGSNAVGEASKPSIRIGTTETGFYSASGQLVTVSNGTLITVSSSTGLRVHTSSGPIMLRTTPTNTNVSAAPNASDPNTGFGWAAADQGSIIAGSQEVVRFAEDSNIGALHFPEITTPTAIANFGSYYTKADDTPYFQDGDGVEHTIMTSDYAGIYVDANATETTITLVQSFEKITVFDTDMPEMISNGAHGTDDITIGNTEDYDVGFNISGSSEGANKVYEFFVFEIAASGATINDITQATPGVVTTVAAHGFSNGDRVKITNVVGMVEVNNRIFTATNVGATTFELEDDNGTDIATGGFTLYDSAGTVVLATRLEQVHAHRKFQIASDIGNLCGDGIVSLTKANTLELWVKGVTDTSDITIESSAFKIRRLS